VDKPDAEVSCQWALTAPESYVLVYGRNFPAEPIKLALAELIARGVLRLIEAQEKWWPFGKKKSIEVLTRGPNAGVALPRSLAAMLELYQAAPQHILAEDLSVVAVDELARLLRRRYRTYERFVMSEVMPTLIEKGLYRTGTQPSYWPFQTSRHVRTPQGDEAAAQLEGWLATTEEEFSELLAADPGAASQFVLRAGAALLLLQQLHPQLRQLTSVVDVGAGMPTGAPFLIYGRPAEFDLPHWDLGVLHAVDSAFDTIGSALDFVGGNGGHHGGTHGGG